MTEKTKAELEKITNAFKESTKLYSFSPRLTHNFTQALIDKADEELKIEHKIESELEKFFYCYPQMRDHCHFKVFPDGRKQFVTNNKEKVIFEYIPSTMLFSANGVVKSYWENDFSSKDEEDARRDGTFINIGY